jgi:hypothetical protein
MIRTRHHPGGKISQTIDGKLVYRGISRDYPVSPDSLTRRQQERMKDYNVSNTQGPQQLLRPGR